MAMDPWALTHGYGSNGDGAKDGALLANGVKAPLLVKSAEWQGGGTVGLGSAPVTAPVSRTGATLGRIDGSRTQFRVGNQTKVGDLLYALPMVKGAPMQGSVGSATSISLAVSVQRAASMPSPGFYGLSTPSITDVTKGFGTAFTFTAGRVGGRVVILGLDQAVTAPGTAQDFAQAQVLTAATGVLRALDQALERADGTADDFKGLHTLCAAGNNNRTAASSADIEKDVRTLVEQITVNGSGGGEGIDCLIGGVKVLRVLMASTAGRQGLSGFARDARTGRVVYHYMGLPYYRADVDESVTGRLYGANLGPTGLNLIYAYGAPETFRLAVEETPVTAATGQREITVHGAFALATWEKEALYEITGIALGGA